MDISPERVRGLLDYDPETGIFRWKVNRRRARRGAVAGCLDKVYGYIRVMIDGKSHLAHRLAWIYQVGIFDREIDHVNLKRDDNRISNLREADRSQNGSNARIRKNNKSGFKGVTKDRASWRAQITHRSKTIKLGSFQTPQEAHAAYCEAAHRLHGEFARVA